MPPLVRVPCVHRDWLQCVFFKERNPYSMRLNNSNAHWINLLPYTTFSTMKRIKTIRYYLFHRNVILVRNHFIIEMKISLLKWNIPNVPLQTVKDALEVIQSKENKPFLSNFFTFICQLVAPLDAVQHQLQYS